MSCENNSTSSLHSDHSQLDESEDPDSIREDDNNAQSFDSGLDPVEEDMSWNSDDGIPDSIGQVVRADHLLKNIPGWTYLGS
jgi:hypothetical protein